MIQDKIAYFTLSIEVLPPQKETVFEHKLGVIPNFVQLGLLKDTSAIRYDLEKSFLKLYKDDKEIRIKNLSENYVFHNLRAFVLAYKRVW